MTELEKLDDMIKIQCSNGNWNYDPYMHGMANGMICARAILTDEEPEYLTAPKKWLSHKPISKLDTKPDERSGYYKPEIGDVYWLVDSDGDVISTIWRDITVYDIHRLSQGNVFRTREEAEHHKKKLDVIGKIRLAAMDDIAENGELDWGDDKIKYYLFYYHNGKYWSVSHAYMAHHHSTIYFKTKASAEQCLADIGNELDILIGEG